MIINNDNDFYAYNGGDVFQVLANKWCSTNNIYCIVVSYSKYEGKVKIFNGKNQVKAITAKIYRTILHQCM